MPREAKHDRQAADVSPLVETNDEWMDVRSVDWQVHTKKGADESAPKTLRIIYGYGLFKSISEYVCVEHFGFARRKAETWWKETTGHGEMSCPPTAEQAATALDQLKQTLRFPCKLLMRFGGQWPEVVGKELAPLSIAVREPGADEQEPAWKASVGSHDDEPPF